MKVVAQKGSRVVHSVTISELRSLTAVMPCAYALGNFIPYFIIFKGQPLPDAKNYPERTALKCSVKGDVDTIQ